MSSRFVIRRCILLSMSASYPHLIHILSHILIIVVVVIVIPVRRRCLVLSASRCHIRLLSHYSILACAPRGPRRTSSEVSCTSGDLEALRTSTLTNVCIWDASKVASICKGKNRRSIFPGFKTICKRELYANGR